MKKVAVYDLEIKNPIEKIQGGWNNHAAMGISCLGLYDYDEDRYMAFDDHTKDEFLKKYFHNEQVSLVTFNGLKFDNEVVVKNWNGNSPPLHKPYDILHEVWQALGKTSFHKGVSLGALCTETLHIKKSGSGAFAPQLFEEKRFAELYSYCLHDVWMTKKLFDFIKLHGYVMSPEYGKIELRSPYDSSN